MSSGHPNFSCGLDAAVYVVGSKWKPLIIWALSERPRRFGELRRELDGVSEKVLSAQLADLTHFGIVLREDHAEVPPRVVYSLTPLGVSLNQALVPLGDWGEQHIEHLEAAFSARSGS